MRRVALLLLLFLMALPSAAQLGRQPMVRAGTPEDRALTEIDAATDPAQRLQLLDRFLAEFGQGDLALLAYERYISTYLADKNFAKAYEYGDKALQADPDNLNIAAVLLRAALEQGDTARALGYGERIGAMLGRFHAAPPPEGMESETWADRKRMMLERQQDQLTYVYYSLFNVAYQEPDPAKKLALFERYLAMFPDSPYVSNARIVSAATMLLLADQWSESGPAEELDKAGEYANKALELLGQAQKPEQLTDEQWAQQKGLQEGLAQSVLGQIHIRKGRNAQAVDAFRAAAPLLQADPNSYSRNQYRLGFALLNLRRNAEARTAFTEAAAADTPYRAAAQKKLAELGGPARPSKRRP